MQALERVEAEALFPPQLRLWTAEECTTLCKMGLLAERYELVEGILSEKMGSGGRHSFLLQALMIALLRLFGGERVRMQCPLQIEGELGRYNEPLPDAVVTREGFLKYPTNPSAEAVLLVVEVSDSSLPYELSAKARLYLRAGLQEYWVLDALQERLIVHRAPTDEGYLEIVAWEKGETVMPLALPEALLEVTELFPTPVDVSNFKEKF
jgi:Uma2 family endonuclease